MEACDPSANQTTLEVGDGRTISFDGETRDDQACGWRLQCPVGVCVVTTVTNFDVERGFDFLRLYGGESASDPELAASPLTGKLDAGTEIGAPTSSLFMQYTSDLSINGGGFEVDVTCGPCGSAGWGECPFQSAGFMDTTPCFAAQCRGNPEGRVTQECCDYVKTYCEPLPTDTCPWKAGMYTSRFRISSLWHSHLEVAL